MSSYSEKPIELPIATFSELRALPLNSALGPSAFAMQSRWSAGSVRLRSVSPQGVHAWGVEGAGAQGSPLRSRRARGRVRAPPARPSSAAGAPAKQGKSGGGGRPMREGP